MSISTATRIGAVGLLVILISWVPLFYSLVYNIHSGQWMFGGLTVFGALLVTIGFFVTVSEQAKGK